jgi:ATP-dependent Clp protease ATP-binding subunit ClpC
LVCSIPGVSFVAATSDGGYRRLAECAPLFVRLLSAIEVEEPNVEDTFLMVRSRSALLEKHHDVRFTDEAVAAAIGWTKRYVPGVALPAKALGALDLAGARAKRRGDIQRAVVSESQVADVVAELGDVPGERLREADADRMLALESELGKRVIGHEKALGRIARHVRRNAAGLRGDRPIGSFLLLGPTGVGKTETAKALAATLFGAPTAMTRIDMSEYAEAHAVARLIGAPPGYVGHEAGGQLTEAVRKRPYQVVLLDEIEKAHRDVLQAFLQVLDEGHLTDGRGRRVDFTNALIVLTSNLGAREVEAERSKRAVGFASSAPASSERLEQTSVAAARKDLPPELFNRIDEVLFFAPLERSEVVSIARLLLGELEKRLETRGVRMEVDAAALDTLLDHGGFDASLGARPMRRAIERLVEAPIADLILRGDVREGSVVLVGADDGVLTIDAVDAPRGRRAEGLARASASV